MMSDRLAKFQIVCIILMSALIVMTPVNFALAAEGNGTITDDYLQDRDDVTNDPTPAAEEGSAAVGLGWFNYLKMLFALILVLGLLIFVLKFINKKSANYQKSSLIRNIGGLTIGAQKSVQLLHIGDKVYIVGVGDDVQLLKEIEDREEVKRLLEYYDEKQTFAQTTPYAMGLLKKVKSNQKKESMDQSQNNEEFQHIFNKRLDEIKKDRSSELEKWKEKEQDK